jgi:hypothetical protein
MSISRGILRKWSDERIRGLDKMRVQSKLESNSPPIMNARQRLVFSIPASTNLVFLSFIGSARR